MAETFPKLFESVTLRHRNLRNRIVFGAHTANMSLDGLPADKHFGYYRERARGGAAMIVVEPVPVHQSAVLTRGNFRHGDDSVIPHFRRITEECRGLGAVMIHQLYHVGGHGDQDNSWAPYWSPSGIPSFHDQHGSHAMTEAEIEELLDAFVAAARRDREAGFDGVDIFAGYNCLVDQFWSPITNKREDRWGGSLENRLRFSVEILSRIRKMAGPDFIIGMTVSGAEPYPGGLSLADKQEIFAYLDERGLVDYFSVGTGSYLNQFGKIVPSFLYDMLLGPPDAAAAKAAVKHALVTCEARVKTPANAEKVLADGHADLVSLVRAQIADPHLANKAADGCAEDVRPCISCNQLCLGRRLRDYNISCLVNPSVGREFDWDGDMPAPAAKPRNILVVGGGPGGLETARICAERGHKVTLFERDSELGGQFRLAAGQPDRGEITQLLTYYQKQLEKLQVQVRLRHEITAQEIRDFGADAVVLASGVIPDRTGFQRAHPHIGELPGVDAENVCTVHDVLSGEVVPGNSVLLLDDLNGWWPASGTALHLAKQRHWVTLVTAADAPCLALETSMTASETRANFVKFGVETVTSTAVLAWEGKAARLQNLITGEEETREFDTLVLATTSHPEDHLRRELDGSGLEVHSVGDCISARTASMAFYEARKLALEL
jgi:2,4-dienoyl-CoA reductase-like NADH-dependent reductase (Old Yellow Enzyme family)/thioredoxin reductase